MLEERTTISKVGDLVRARPITLIVLIALASLTYLGVRFLYGGSLRPDSQPPSETEDHVLTLPPSARILEAKTDPPDSSGNYSMCAAFTLPEADMMELRKRGFDWLPGLERDSDGVEWTRGPPPPDLNRMIEILGGFQPENCPAESATYNYVLEWTDGGWWQVIAMDESEGMVFFCRSSW